MAVPVSAVPHSPESTAASLDRERILASEWPIYAVVLSSACIVIGLVWDISWHRTIGRDTFWSPPHLLQQAGAIIAGLSCGYLALSTTFAGSPEARDKSVRFWRFFQAPLGAWVCIWGTLMMITSAPFDNWWHNAYGLDVKIISPPHMVLASGMIGVELGAMLMALGAQNRARSDSDRRRLGNIFAFAAGTIIVMVGIMITEDASFGNEMHGSLFYKMTGLMIPLFLVAFARASRLSWPATRIAIIYMLISMISIWVLQLVPARPLLAPIYNAVTHMVPMPFPLLLFIPAIALDMLMRRFGEDRDWLLSVVLGVAFVAVMLAVHWYWAKFLLSPYARNFFFAADQWDYTNRLGPWQYEYWNLDRDSAGKFSPAGLAKGLLVAALLATASSRLGLWWGKGMSKVQR
ncbi:MAG TPA: hypothetical protein VM939_06865 [Gemmatimonadaceae bacterium]|nr:hypothetical protein [Gemmatimonadaceae bacterium]